MLMRGIIHTAHKWENISYCKVHYSRDKISFSVDVSLSTKYRIICCMLISTILAKTTNGVFFCHCSFNSCRDNS